MSGVIILAAVSMWTGLGLVLWKLLVRPRVRGVAALYAATGGSALLWFVGPVADEILGAREFKRLCDEMPGLEFHGPVSVGTGRFYQPDGTPTWSSNDDLRKIPFAEWHQIFARTEATRSIGTWPVPVVEQIVNYTQTSSGKAVLIVHWRGSPGGWIKRVTGWGSHAPYQCTKHVGYPPRKDWIKF